MKGRNNDREKRKQTEKHTLLYITRAKEKKEKGKPTQQNRRTHQATPTPRLTTCSGQHTSLHGKGKDCNGTNPHNLQKIREYCSEHRRKAQGTLGERGTSINQIRTKLYTKLVRDCIPKSYEVAYQSRTKLHTKVVRSCIPNSYEIGQRWGNFQGTKGAGPPNEQCRAAERMAHKELIKKEKRN